MIASVIFALALMGAGQVFVPIFARMDWLSASLLLLQCLCVVTMIAVLEHMSP